MDTYSTSDLQFTPANPFGLPHPPARAGRALVLGGGGAAGNAWLIGVLAGLADAGLDVTGADLTVGTSAGATAAAQLAGADATRLFSELLAAPPPSTRARPDGTGPGTDHLRRLTEVIASSADAADLRRRMGEMALEVTAASDITDRWRAAVEARFSAREWPDRRVLLTAVDARTGEPVVFDGNSGVGLVDAVAASTAGGGFAYRIGEHFYIDGGYRRSSENADLAAGSERVLVLSPLGGRVLTPVEWGTPLATQLEELRAGGSRVETILPDGASLAAFGDNMTALSARIPAARAGYEQGRAAAGRIGEFWQ
ncbi:patatin-like phospholipase family protein [Amnibacterium flavum]|uniref:Patatin n=1 Tax=Amnibacterium flavum TaxID=2173173 RepID=A0A2V1HRM3_9MICO|nr:patatin-like phospholipase family protein [Amnibacterium flavum]PVZ95253.1 patatin [Amnibacterium flavum]